MAIDLLYTHELQGIVEAIPQTPLAMRDLFFGTKKQTNKSKIILDVEVRKREYSAQPVDPTIDAPIRNIDDDKVDEIEPAYIKEKGVITPKQLSVRTLGEAIGGSLSLDSRLAERYLRLIENQSLYIDVCLELWACQALLNGSYSVQSPYYTRSPINLGRTSTLKPTALSGTDRWLTSGVVGATANPIANIQSLISLINDESGANVDIAILGANASKGFELSPKVKELADNNYRISEVRYVVDPKNDMGLRYITTLSNDIQVWSYNKKYDVNKTTKEYYFDPDSIAIVSSKSFGGVQYNGNIQHMSFLSSAEKYVASYQYLDGSGLDVTTHSAPILIPRNVNASASWKVC